MSVFRLIQLVAGMKYILSECFIILFLVMQLQKAKKKCCVPAYQSEKKKQNSLATMNVRATDIHSKNKKNAEKGNSILT